MCLFGFHIYYYDACSYYTYFTDFGSLTKMMKELSMKIVDQGGIVRSIQNHGIRQFPHRVQAKNPDYKTGQRYYPKGRFISLYYDASPAALKEVEKALNLNDQVLRKTHLKARSKVDWINMQDPKKNPYIQRILRQDARETQTKAEAISTGRSTPPQE